MTTMYCPMSVSYLCVVFPSFEVEEVFFECLSGLGVSALICDVGIFFVAGALVVLTVTRNGNNSVNTPKNRVNLLAFGAVTVS